MKTFSRLSLFMIVCFASVLMLLGNAVHSAQEALEVGTDTEVFIIGEPVQVTFRVDPLQAGVTLKLTGDGIKVIDVNGDAAAMMPGDFDTLPAPPLGSVTANVIITAAGAFVQAEWPDGGTNGLLARADLFGDDPPPNKPIIKVLAPEPCDYVDPDHVDPNGTPSDITFDPKERVKVGDVFKQRIVITDVADLSAWQMNVVFNPHILEVVSIKAGDFLSKGDPHDDADDVDALFLNVDGQGWIPVKNGQFSTAVAEGVISASQARIEPGAIDAANSTAKRVGSAPNLSGASGNGTLMEICFRVLEYAEEQLGLHNIQLSDSSGSRISYSIQVNDFIVVTDEFTDEDVNRDGYVNIQDLVLVASNIGLVPGNLHNYKADANGDGNYGEGDNVRSGMYTEFEGPNNSVTPDLPSVGDSHSRVDVNDDGIVNVLDLIQVAMSPNWGKLSPVTKNSRDANVASLSAPANFTPATIQAWINLAQVEDDGSAIFDLGIANLEALLASRIPSETKLLLNYPNPFNPETWIPYQLAKATDVTVTIHSMNGSVIRTLELGHQVAGTYQSKSQAAYWDGRNEFGEQVASGLYFYTLTAGDFSATGRMLVRK